MSTEYEPMDQVRKNFRISWYRCSIGRDVLKKLTMRSNLRGWDNYYWYNISHTYRGDLEPDSMR